MSFHAERLRKAGEALSEVMSEQRLGELKGRVSLGGARCRLRGQQVQRPGGEGCLV